MKKLVSLLFFLFWVWGIAAQPLHYLRTKNYDGTYSEMSKTPIWTYYELTKEKLTGSVKLDRNHFLFKANPLIPNTNFNKDYLHSDYDRGHMMPAADNNFDNQGMKECFYFTNIVPQTPELNRGPWKKLEDYERNLVKDGKELIVLCGTLGDEDEIGQDKIVVPKYCWKIIIAKDVLKNIADTLGYLFENDKDCKNDPIFFHEKKYQTIEKYIGMNVKDLVELHYIKDPQKQAEYMVSSMKSKLNNTLNETLSKEEVIKRYKNKYTDPSQFQSVFKNKGIEISNGFTVDGFISNSYSESLSKMNTEVSNFTSEINSKGNDFNFVLDKFANSAGLISVFTKAQICPCCGLPLSFPICGCKILIE